MGWAIHYQGEITDTRFFDCDRDDSAINQTLYSLARRILITSSEVMTPVSLL